MNERVALEGRLLWDGQEAVRRLRVAHNGMTYPGEVVILRGWNPRWGGRLEGDTYFRVVFLTEPQKASQVKVGDPGIAVCVPAAATTVEKELLQREVRSLREARERYVVRAEGAEEGLRRVLESQERALEARLLQAQATLYRQGQVITATEVPVGEEAFAGGRLEDWAEAIALRLLASRYPTPWLRLSLLARPLVPEDAGALFAALFAAPDDPQVQPLGLRSSSEPFGVKSSGEPQPNPPQVNPQTNSLGTKPLEEMGPALGFSTLAQPRRFDPEGCPLFETLRDKLADRAEVPWGEVYHYLAHGIGLTEPFALLFLLAFVYHRRAQVELRLRPGHTLTLRDGQRIPGSRLIGELVPMLSWRVELGESVAAICQPRDVSWNSAFHYTRLVCSDLMEAEEEGDVRTQEEKLQESLRQLAREVRLGRETLAAIASSGLSLLAEGMEERLERLAQVADSDRFRQVFRRARALYGAPGRLAQELEELRRLLRLHPLLPELLDARSYLEGAVIGPGRAELSIERAALLERVVMPVALEGAHVWQATKASFNWFKQRYMDTYAAFHASYHDEAAALRLRLEQARRNAVALGFLNSLTELGRPVGTELASRVEQLAQRVRSCSAAREALQLEHSPRCLQCHLSLGEKPPTGEVTTLVGEVEAALGEQNQRLSRLLVRDIMQGRADQRLDDLLKVVQASDLSALVNTLDEEMVEYIRGVLTR